MSRAARSSRPPPTQLTVGRAALAALFQLLIAVFVIVYAHDGGALRSLARWPDARSIVIGAGVGALLAALQSIALRASPAWREFSERAIAGTSLGVAGIVLVSLFVGVAEELLFRAALQPLLGIGLTSLVFSIVHWNYAALRGPGAAPVRSALAFATIFGIGVALGVLCERAGLAAAIAAHTIYDMIVLFVYRTLFRW